MLLTLLNFLLYCWINFGPQFFFFAEVMMIEYEILLQKKSVKQKKKWFINMEQLIDYLLEVLILYHT